MCPRWRSFSFRLGSSAMMHTHRAMPCHAMPCTPHNTCAHGRGLLSRLLASTMLPFCASLSCSRRNTIAWAPPAPTSPRPPSSLLSWPPALGTENVLFILLIFLSFFFRFKFASLPPLAVASSGFFSLLEHPPHSAAQYNVQCAR